jgi:hypothetical protein
MTESILDRLDREPGGARQYIATLIVVDGATRAQVAEALAKKYNVPAPTGRSITAWKTRDSKLCELIEQMTAAKRDLAPGDDPTALLRPPVNVAQADADLFNLAVDCPAFGDLIAREIEREEKVAPTTAWGAPVNPDAPDPDPAADPDDEDEPPSDVIAVLLTDYETVEEREADCLRRLGDYQWHPV